MFETMTGFLWFFFVGLALIVGGILFEEKLVVFETWLFGKIRKLVRGGRRG